MFITTKNFTCGAGPWIIRGVGENEFGLFLKLDCGQVMLRSQKVIDDFDRKLNGRSGWVGAAVELSESCSPAGNDYIRVSIAATGKKADAVVAKAPISEASLEAETEAELKLCQREPEIDPETRITYEIQTMTERHARLLSHSKDEKLILERQMQNVRDASSKVNELATQIAQVMDEFNKKQKMYVSAIKLLQTEISGCKDLLDRATQLLRDEGIPIHELVPEYEPITWKVPVEHLAALASQIEAADALSSPSVEYLFRMAHSLPIPKRLQRLRDKRELAELFDAPSENQLVG